MEAVIPGYDSKSEAGTVVGYSHQFDPTGVYLWQLQLIGYNSSIIIH